MGAVSVIVIWGLTGRIFHYSDTWQLIINTGTTIVTFLMVFLIQNTQNRDSKAIQLKLDEIIRSLSGARNHLIDLETLSDEDLQQLQDEFQRLRKLSESKTGRRAELTGDRTQVKTCRPLLECRAVVREVCPASLKLANEMAAAMGGNYRRILDQILSRERIYTRCRNNLRGPSWDT